MRFTLGVWCLNGLMDGSAKFSPPFRWAGVAKKKKKAWGEGLLEEQGRGDYFCEHPYNAPPVPSAIAQRTTHLGREGSRESL